MLSPTTAPMPPANFVAKASVLILSLLHPNACSKSRQLAQSTNATLIQQDASTAKSWPLLSAPPNVQIFTTERYAPLAKVNMESHARVVVRVHAWVAKQDLPFLLTINPAETLYAQTFDVCHAALHHVASYARLASISTSLPLSAQPEHAESIIAWPAATPPLVVYALLDINYQQINYHACLSAVIPIASAAFFLESVQVALQDLLWIQSNKRASKIAHLTQYLDVLLATMTTFARCASQDMASSLEESDALLPAVPLIALDVPMIILLAWSVNLEKSQVLQKLHA